MIKFKLSFYICCLFCIHLVAYEILNSNGQCVYWYYEDSPDKHNPCNDDNGKSYVPDNAIPLWII